MRISVLLIVPMFMLCEAVTKELLTGDRLCNSLKLVCSNQPDDWNLRQNQGPAVIVSHQRSEGKYSCVGTLATTMTVSRQCRQGVTIDEKEGKQIAISTIAKNDAGTYDCTSETTIVVVVDEESIDLRIRRNTGSGEHPRNNEVSPGEDIRISCSAKYAGSQFPSMEVVIRDHNGNGRILDTTSVNPVQFTFDGLASIEHSYTVAHSDKKFAVICRFPKLPSMSRKEEFSTIYGPIFHESQKNVALLPGESVVLICSADVYPSATYAWFKVNKETESPMIGETTNYVTVNALGHYRCVATNTQNGAKVSKNFAVVTNNTMSHQNLGKTASGANIGAIIGGVIGGIAFLVIVVVGVVCLLRRRSRRMVNGHGNDDDDGKEEYADEKYPKDDYRDEISPGREPNGSKRSDDHYAELEHAVKSGNRKPPPADHTDYSTVKQPSTSTV